MKNKVEDVLSLLPSIDKITVKGEADYYGVSALIARKYRLPFIPRSLAGWKHGWVGATVKYPEQLTNGASYSRFLVSSVKQERFLKSKGFKAKAVGMPFVYIEDFETQKVKRQQNTLLVMPPHSLPYTEHSWDEDGYAKQISELRNKFDFIVVCLHQSCIDKGLWVHAFEKYDIPWIIGADAQDKNALIRMYRIFNWFEFMTTNTIGSHVAYAAYCGCKVSIYGEYAEFSEEDYLHDPYYNKFPFLLPHNLKYSSYRSISKIFPFLFVSPEQAETRIKWAENQLGKDNKVTFNKLTKLLGWRPDEQVIFYIKQMYFKIIKAI